MSEIRSSKDMRKVRSFMWMSRAKARGWLAWALCLMCGHLITQRAEGAVWDVVSGLVLSGSFLCFMFSVEWLAKPYRENGLKYMREYQDVL